MEFEKFIMENLWLLLFAIMTYVNRPTRIYAIFIVGIKIVYTISPWMVIIALFGAWITELTVLPTRQKLRIDIEALQHKIEEMIDAALNRRMQ